MNFMHDHLSYIFVLKLGKNLYQKKKLDIIDFGKINLNYYQKIYIILECIFLRKSVE